jgi:hypothetical protein
MWSASDFYGRLAALLGKGSDAESRRSLAQANHQFGAAGHGLIVKIPKSLLIVALDPADSGKTRGL